MASLHRFLFLAALFTALSACGGGDSSGPLLDETDVTGLWRGTVTISTAPCPNNPYGLGFSFVHSVSQDDSNVTADDQDGIHYVGHIVGDHGFSVDAAGPQAGIVGCDLFYRLRYDSINDSDDRTADVSITVTEECAGGNTC